MFRNRTIEKNYMNIGFRSNEIIVYGWNDIGFLIS